MIMATIQMIIHQVLKHLKCTRTRNLEIKDNNGNRTSNMYCAIFDIKLCKIQIKLFRMMSFPEISFFLKILKIIQFWYLRGLFIFRRVYKYTDQYENLFIYQNGYLFLNFVQYVCKIFKNLVEKVFDEN